jgi:SAM-dependent methyltransferase
MPYRGSLRFGFGDLGAQRRRAVHPVDGLDQATLVNDGNSHRYLQRLRMPLCCVDDLPGLLSGDPHHRRILCFVVRSMSDSYTHGHHDSVLRSHRWRTAENSAGYLLPYLRSGLSLLDVGCGPGTITVDLGRRVAPASVIGVDRERAVIAEATRLLEAGNLGNVQFKPGDVYSLEFDDQSFDVVHAHQVLQHLTDPVAALVEMRRVTRRGGIVAVRDSDYGGFVWAPTDPLLDRWMQLYHDVCRCNGADADAGRHLLGWAHAAGFDEIVATSSTWTFADAATRRWWGGLWAERVTRSSLATQAVEYGLSTEAELEAISRSWLRWAEQDDGFFAVLHVELIARRK